MMEDMMGDMMVNECNLWQWRLQFAIENGLVEIVDFSIDSMVTFPSVMQRFTRGHQSVYETQWNMTEHSWSFTQYIKMDVFQTIKNDDLTGYGQGRLPRCSKMFQDVPFRLWFFRPQLNSRLNRVQFGLIWIDSDWFGCVITLNFDGLGHFFH